MKSSGLKASTSFAFYDIIVMEATID